MLHPGRKQDFVCFENNVPLIGDPVSNILIGSDSLFLSHEFRFLDRNSKLHERCCGTRIRPLN